MHVCLDIICYHHGVISHTNQYSDDDGFLPASNARLSRKQKRHTELNIWSERIKRCAVCSTFTLDHLISFICFFFFSSCCSFFCSFPLSHALNLSLSVYVSKCMFLMALLKWNPYSEAYWLCRCLRQYFIQGIQTFSSSFESVYWSRLQSIPLSQRFHLELKS